MTDLTSEQCLQILHRGANEMRRGNLDVAGQLFSAVLASAKGMPKEQSYALLPIATANLSLLATRRGKPTEAAQLRSVALTVFDAISAPPLHPGFLQLMGDALFDLGEHRRAIPWYELCAQLVSDNGDAINTAALLNRAGQCYCRAGLLDHAVIPLRAAIKIFRQHPGDPRMPDALLNLGNALRKSSPAAAEEIYKEAATWYESRLQLEAAAPAWVNLGILCSENGRHQEALEWYRRTLEVRERSLRTPPVRVASVHNNIANCYRRLGRLTDAHTHVDRAIAMLESADASDQAAARLLPSACHSRALIFVAELRDQDALVWFMRADAQRQSLPSPSLDETAVDLTELIAVLERLGRTPEADAARERLAHVRAVQQSGHAAELDLGGLSGEDRGAVLIEIDNPAIRSQETANGMAELGRRLGEEAAANSHGHYTGSVTIPEAVTLMFHAADPEALYRTLEPALRAEPLARTARVTLRNGTQLREITLGAN
jgi:tetratricopeptide (TPR) repeat protein